jgi:exosortase D (VPLPA-CTERM-specific)
MFDMRFFTRYWPLLPLAAIPFLYAPALHNLWQRWLTETEFSHGILIPFLSAYVIYDRWGDLKRGAGRGSVAGVVLIAVAVVMLLLGEISALFAAKQVSFVLLLLGVAYAYLGKRCGAMLTAPILMLLFAIPPPYFIEAILTSRLQLLSSELGVIFIRWMDIPVFLSGNVIDLGAVQLEVVEACSGLRFLYPLMSIGFIVAYFYQAHIAKRLLIFFSTVPITILMNSVRIALTAILVEQYGQVVVEGTVHDAEGWLTFAGCLLLLFGEIWLLERVTTKRSLIDVLSVKPKLQQESSSGGVTIHTPIVYSAVALLLVAGISLHTLSRIQQSIAPETHLALFPHQLDAWRAQPAPIDSEVARKLQFSDHLMLNFNHPDHIEPINLYVAFYANQRNGESPHSPRVCIPGGGWEIETFERITLKGIPMNRTVIVREGQKLLVYYWFAERGTLIANEYYKKWLLLQDFVRTGRSDGALIRVSMPVVDAEHMERSEEKIANFIALAQPMIQQYLPNSSLN